MRQIFIKLFDIREEKSLATKFRKKRFSLFLSLIAKLQKPLKILDVGGTQVFWERMNFIEENGIEIVLFNLSKEEVKHKNLSSIIGDVRDMSIFGENEFDIVFSNSLLQYVGVDGYLDQCRIAKEIQRVGKRYFVQTPNRNFPIEPHFLFPFFQFLPRGFQIFLISCFNLGWREKIQNRQKAIQLINSIRLLKKKELKNLFPNAIIIEEKIFGLTKSFIAYEGW